MVASEGSLLQVSCQETRESMTFSVRNLANQAVDSERPLYVTSFLGSLSNQEGLGGYWCFHQYLPLLTLDVLGIPRERITQKPLQVVGIWALQQCILGHVSLDLRTGPIRERTLMHVMGGDTSYHIILGCPWRKVDKVVAFVYH